MSAIIETVRERCTKVLDAANEIQAKADLEERKMTAEELRDWTAFMDEHEELKAELQRRERAEAAKTAMEKAERKSAIQQPETAEGTAARIELPRHRYGELKAFKPRNGETQRDAEERAYKSGMWCRAVIYGDHRATEWCTRHGIQLRTPQSEGVNTLGGALVPDEMSQAIIDLRNDYGVFRRNAKVVPMGSDHILIPRRVSGLTVYPLGENASITESNKSWDQVELTAKKWAGLAKYSSELAEDAIINVADDLASEIAYAFANKEDDCAFNGDGTHASYHGTVGILTKMIDGSHTGSYYTAPGGANTMDTMGEVTDAALAGVVGQCPDYVLTRGNPKWYCPTAGVALVFERLARAAGGVTRTEMENGGRPTSYWGYPIVPVNVWTGTGSTDFSNIIMLLFGDMSLAATLGDRRGFAIKVSSDRYLEYDQLAIVGTTRFDINIHDVGQGSAAGPLVGLLGN